MTKKSILYIGNKLSKSGANVTSIETLGSFLKQEGFNVYTSSAVSNKFFRLIDMTIATFKYSRKVSVVLIDTYSTQNFYFAVWIAKICRLLNKPYIPILRGGMLPQRLTKSPRLCKKLFDGAKINVAPSMYLMNAFIDKGYTNLKYIPNTIKIENYPFLLRNEIKSNIFWLRSFSKLYNPLLAIEILSELKQTQTEASLCMVGPEVDGSLKACKKLSEENNLEIFFPGKLDKKDWIDLSTGFDIFINTTNFDNTPVSVIEAMALGFPIISTNVGGMNYLIEDGKDGILIEPNNCRAFIAEILYLMNSPEKVKLLSQNARKKAESFDWKNVLRLWSAILR